MTVALTGRRILAHLAGALGALWLLGPSVPPHAASDAPSPSAILLVARSALPDPDFSDAVVLVMNNLGPAPAGVIINRPTRIPVAHLFPDLARIAKLKDKLYFGGPVQLGAVWFLFRASKAPEHAVKTCEGVYLSADPALLRQLLGRDRPMEGLRIFLGHSGWAPGQLEAEISRGDWQLERAAADAIFTGKSEHPWPSPEPEPGESAESATSI